MQKYKDEVSGSSFQINFADYALEYYDKGIKAFDKSIETGYSSDSLYQSLFWIYYDSNNFENAIQAIINKESDNWELQRLLGLAYYKIKDYTSINFHTWSSWA